MASKYLWVYSQAIILLVLTLERQVVVEGEANTSGARREERGVVRGSYLWAEQELVLWSHWGTLHVYRGIPSCPHLGPLRLGSIVTEKKWWLYPWQPPSLAHTCPPLVLHGDWQPRKRAQSRSRRESEGPVHGERNNREAGGLGLHDGEVIILVR